MKNPNIEIDHQFKDFNKNRKLDNLIHNKKYNNLKQLNIILNNHNKLEKNY